MAYEKQTWNTGDTITAAKLNHMEDGIAAGGNTYDIIFTDTGTTGAVGESFDTLKNKITNGTIQGIFLFVNGDDSGASIAKFVGYSWEPDSQDNSIVNILFNVSDGTSIALSSNGTGYYLDSSEFTWTYDSATKTYTFTPVE